jgi:hypothetical protein
VPTPSGLALTSAQVAAGRATVTARERPSGPACAARIVGSDAAHGLTLLQLACGGVFQPVALGNSRDVTAGDAAVAVSTSASGRSFTPVTGNVGGTSAATTIAGHRLTGLLQATAPVIPGPAPAARWSICPARSSASPWRVTGRCPRHQLRDAHQRGPYHRPAADAPGPLEHQDGPGPRMRRTAWEARAGAAQP